MAELVAGALLSAMFDKLFERLASPELRRNSTAGYKLKQLESKLQRARLYLDDAENRQLRDKDIKEWLDNLKHLVFLVDDISEDIHDSKNRNSGRKFLMEFLKSIFQCLAGTVRGELDEILMELDGLLDQVTALGLNHCDGTAREGGSSSTANPAPLLAQHHVFGRNDDKDVILGLLLSDKAFGNQKKIGVVPIVGMGGIGKTTLAQLAYHDTTQLSEDEFKAKAWVTVSTEFDVVRILKSILLQINQGAVETGELSQLQEKMKDALTGKKFLIVLDDVWDENYSNWNLLKSNFEWGALGSRIVVTTRSEKVGDMVKTGPIHKLREVSSEDCWSIFIDHAFSAGDSDSNPQLHEIGRKIVEKCGGLPLAVMAMGGLLCSTRDLKEWKNVLDSPVWNCGENNQGHEVLPSLWLSYRYLPSSVKQCFAYCSVFPQDYEFDKEQMVLLWMAEGFLPSGKTETRSVEEVGEKYFDILVSRSLFQRSSINESKFVMHDLIHDLAAFVSGAFCVSVKMEDEEFKHVTVRTRHLSHDYMELDSKLLSGVSEAKHLSSFLCQREQYGMSCNDEFVKKLTTNHRRLRALSIVANSASFCNLKHLRFLNLSDCKFGVPSSLGTLHLQTLILSNCGALTQLPTDITKLIKLRYLYISGSELITHIPLDQFPTLRKLKLWHCRNLKAVTNDGNSESLTEMELVGCPELESLLGLPKSLTHLRIGGCSKLVAPESRLGLQNLPALVTLLIRDCECESAATSSSSELFAQVLLPSSLASLALHNLRGFKSINGSAFQQAKSLTTLDIQFCDELESLPEEELPISLSTLKIFYCLLLEKKYHKTEGDESYQHISHIPNIDIYGATTKEIIFFQAMMSSSDEMEIEVEW